MPDRPKIETLMMANHVEAINNLLYISGGGWTDHWRAIVNGQPVPSLFGVAVTILVPWSATNAPHQLAIWFESGDGQQLNPPIQATFNMGRPAGLSPGADQRATLALQLPGMVFAKDGDYCVKARIGPIEAETPVVNFRVHQLPLPPGAPIPPPSPMLPQPPTPQ